MRKPGVALCFASIVGASCCGAGTTVTDGPAAVDAGSTAETPPRVQMKLVPGSALEDPTRILPTELRSDVVAITPLFTLDDRPRGDIGAAWSERWFLIILRDGSDPSEFAAELMRLDEVEFAEPAPGPSPEP